MKSSFLLAGASMIALTIGAQTAEAAAPTIVYGGGSTLAAKVYRDIFNCFATAADGIFSTSPGNSTIGSPPVIAYPTAENGACTKQGTANDVIGYEPVGSGSGLKAWTTGSPANFGSPSTTSNTIAYLDGTYGISTTPYPQIQFAASDAYLTSSTQVSEASAAVGGETVFQLPVFATPIVLALGQKQNVKLTSTSKGDVCALFAGATNKTASGVTISELVVRADSSGTSFIFADWLAQNCDASYNFNATNGFPSTTPNWTAVNQGKLTVVAETGTGGVASTVASTPNALGYVSPDYVYPVVASSTAYPTYVNGQLPTVAATKLRLGRLTYPTSYNTATIGSTINNALTAPGGSGYPIVGFTFIDTYSCYSVTLDGGLIGGPAQGKALSAALKIFYANGEYLTILNNSGFSAAPGTLVTLLKSAGAPLNATSGIQNNSCPKK